MSLLRRYRRLLSEVMDQPIVPSVRSSESIGSGWGRSPRPFRESIGDRIRVESDSVLLASSARPVNAAYALVSSAWMILGRKDVGSLSPFNPRGHEFSTDGFTLSAAFGDRLRVAEGDQISRVIGLLEDDPTSRRAIAYIGLPKDLDLNLRDFPCASVVQFLGRATGLHAVVYMRSQSLFGVFPYDVVNFRYLQKYVAWRLGYPVGPLDMLFGSVHVYEEEVERVTRFLVDEAAGFQPIPELPWEELAAVFRSWTDPARGPDRVADYLRRTP